MASPADDAAGLFEWAEGAARCPSKRSQQFVLDANVLVAALALPCAKVAIYGNDAVEAMHPRAKNAADGSLNLYIRKDPPAAARSASTYARSWHTRPAGMEGSRARSRASIGALPSPVTTQRMPRARSIAG
jgi:hypothetical protein